MVSICAVCAANKQCQCYDAGDSEKCERCDVMLEALIEEYRQEYRSAWYRYTKQFQEC